MARLVIANRGEIARRILRTARGRGMKVAVVSTAADARALVRDEADHVLEVSSFLDIDAIVAAGRAWGADLLHPGYGYLSESPSFAAAVERAGIAFVGPTADNMRALGGKEAARALAASLGVPTLPALPSKDLARLPPQEWASALQARGIRPPYLIKASCGGGGKGMRVAADPTELEAAVARAAEEARAAFADGTVFIEQLLPAPRHVEIQVFGDGRGGGVFWGERECSLQRRHQKVMEEAPSSRVGETLREALGRAALGLVRSTAYRGAGTVEFLLEEGGGFHFLEVNTRLQVEHPVTELVYGIDLIEAQLDLAEGRWPAGFPDPSVFSLPNPRGQAFEARVLAEDPRNGFLPTPGTIRRYREPTGIGVRVDSGVAEGREVTTAFDSLLAKLIVHGPDRETALGRLTTAIESYVIHGCGTNLPFLHALALHPDVRAGRVDTRWIDTHIDELNGSRLNERLRDLLASPSFATLLCEALDGGASGLGTAFAGRFTDQAQAFPSFPFRRAGRIEAARPDADGQIVLTGPGLDAALAADRARPRARLTATRLSPREVIVSGWGETWQLSDPRGGGHRSGASLTVSGEVKAPMAGTVVEIRVSPGQAVDEGQVLFVVESMKMQLEVRSPRSGVVREVFVAPDQTLAGPDLLAAIDGPGLGLAAR
jgi:acetyl/propionyl-CoA carboxylase alpha subunit